MAKLKWQLVTEWEKEHNKEFPKWALVWTYDGYGECWGVAQWEERKEYYANERKDLREDKPLWDFQFEPMVALPTDDWPQWGDGKALRKEGGTR